jgi:thioredoxin-related protein
MTTINIFKGAAIATVMMIAGLSLTSWDAPKPSEGQVEIGDPFPMSQHAMMNIDGSETFLRQEMKDNGLLVVFSCNTCPFVIQWENRYNEIYDMCEKNNIGMVLINSNEAKRTGDDSMVKMKEHAKAEGYKMKYLVDENHVVADAFGARTTPHFYMFDKNAMLAYRGSIDDNSENKADVQERYLADAITAMAADKEISPNITKSIGCSIKRVKK